MIRKLALPVLLCFILCSANRLMADSFTLDLTLEGPGSISGIGTLNINPVTGTFLNGEITFTGGQTIDFLPSSVLQLPNGDVVISSQSAPAGFQSFDFIISGLRGFQGSTVIPFADGYASEAANCGGGDCLVMTPVTGLVFPTPAPEPSSLVLLGSGLAIVLSRFRRRPSA